MRATAPTNPLQPLSAREEPCRGADDTRCGGRSALLSLRLAWLLPHMAVGAPNTRSRRVGAGGLSPLASPKLAALPPPHQPAFGAGRRRRATRAAVGHRWPRSRERAAGGSSASAVCRCSPPSSGLPRHRSTARRRRWRPASAQQSSGRHAAVDGTGSGVVVVDAGDGGRGGGYGAIGGAAAERGGRARAGGRL